MTKKISENRSKNRFAKLGIFFSTAIFLAACKTAPVVEPVKKTPPPPPPKPVKTYSNVNIGSNNYMNVPSSWKLVSSYMPKGYVRYTIKANGVHMVITGFESSPNRFSMSKNRKELDSKTLLYKTNSSPSYHRSHASLTNGYRAGEYVQYQCRSNNACYQVFPLSKWKSVIAAEFQAGNMKYNITAGVNGLSSVAAKDVVKALQSVQRM